MEDEIEQEEINFLDWLQTKRKLIQYFRSRPIYYPTNEILDELEEAVDIVESFIEDNINSAITTP